MAATTNLSAIIHNSPAVRREWESGTPATFTPYTPTDLDVDGTAELYGAWRPSAPVCGICFMICSVNGACGC